MHLEVSFPDTDVADQRHHHWTVEQEPARTPDGDEGVVHRVEWYPTTDDPVAEEREPVRLTFRVDGTAGTFDAVLSTVSVDSVAARTSVVKPD